MNPNMTPARARDFRRALNSDLDIASTTHVLASTLRPNDFLITPYHHHTLRSAKILSVNTSTTSPHMKKKIHLTNGDEQHSKELVVSASDMVMVPKITAVVGKPGHATYEGRADTLRRKYFMVIVGCPCNIIDMSVLKAGRREKYHFVASDVIREKVLQTLVRDMDMITVPAIMREELLLVDISEDGFLSLMRNGGNGTTKDDIKAPDNSLGEDITKTFNNGEAQNDVFVAVLTALGEEVVIGVREDVVEETWEMI